MSSLCHRNTVIPGDRPYPAHSPGQPRACQEEKGESDSWNTQLIGHCDNCHLLPFLQSPSWDWGDGQGAWRSWQHWPVPLCCPSVWECRHQWLLSSRPQQQMSWRHPQCVFCHQETHRTHYLASSHKNSESLLKESFQKVCQKVLKLLFLFSFYPAPPKQTCHGDALTLCL